jgi:hypothetical protein
MPNNQKVEPCKDRVDKLAAKAKSDLDKIKKDNPELALDLQPVYESLKSIAGDPHK